MNLNRRFATVSLVVAAAAAVTAAAVPLAASGDSTRPLYLGMNLHLTGPNTSEGAFVASGAVADSGGVDVSDLTIAPAGSGDAGRLSGTETYTGQQGKIVTTFQGVAFPLSSPHEVGIGRFDIVSGTGAYAGVTGRGTFEIVVDATTNQLIGTETALLHR
jgi:hypothetical protein